MRKLIFLLFVMILGINVTYAQNETLVTSFESGTEGWALVTDWASGVSINVSDAFASDGAQSLSVSVNYAATQWQEAGVFFQPPQPLDWSSYTTLSVDIYVPAEAENFIAQLYTKTGDSWSWTNTPNIALTPDAWTTVTADLSAMGIVRDVREFGIKFATYEANFTGEFYVDRVVLSSTPQTDAELVLVPAEVRAITSVEPLAESVGRYEKFEVAIQLDADFNNPYDPRDIQVDATFTAPSGDTITVPGFYYRAFEVSDSQTLTELDEWSWRVRFTPTEVGEWQYRILATTAAGTIQSDLQTFTVTESDSRGFVRVDARNPRYLAFDDGSPYFPVGENMGWSTGNSLVDFAAWMDELAAAGGNFIRVWMASWEFGIEWLDTGLGNYENRQDNAFELDQVFEMAHEHDIYIMLTLLNHGAFSLNVNTEWESNPFNAANGGPLNDPVEFATNPEALRLWQQRLRYIAARWGYSTNLMAWEWWNEVNWTPIADPDILETWIPESAAYLSTLDPYDHLITHSGSQVGDTGVWGHESIDFTQNHMYNMDDLVYEFSLNIAQWLENYPDKPFLMGEFGSPIGIDENGLLLHLGLWSAPMYGAAGTGMFWWWDTYIHPNDLYYHFAAISAYYADEDMGAREWQLTTAVLSEDAPAQILGLQAADYALLWVVNEDYSMPYLINTYEENRRNGVENPRDVAFPEVSGVSLTVSGLNDGTYTVEFWDTMTGVIVESSQIEISGGTATIALPTFITDLAVKIKP
jgi:hypothetical protein